MHAILAILLTPGVVFLAMVLGIFSRLGGRDATPVVELIEDMSDFEVTGFGLLGTLLIAMPFVLL